MHLPAHQHLDDLGIAYERAEFSPDTDKGAASVARALGYQERQMIKTLIFQLHTGESLMDEPVLGVGTGVWGHEILITPPRLVEASNAILVNLTDREKASR